MAELLKTDGTRTTITPKNGTDFTFEECYPLLGCDTIQIVETNDGRILLIDEEGKLKMNLLNAAATALYQYGHLDPIIGHAIVCDSEQLR